MFTLEAHQPWSVHVIGHHVIPFQQAHDARLAGRARLDSIRRRRDGSQPPGTQSRTYSKPVTYFKQSLQQAVQTPPCCHILYDIGDDISQLMLLLPDESADNGCA